MYPKLQSKGLAGGPNTGSCAAYAYYLEHENNWKKEKGRRKDIIPFFDPHGDKVSMTTVINTIDANKKGLHVNDAKFFSLVISPSPEEAARLGASRKEKLQSIQKMVDQMMDRYAVGFDKEEIQDHNNLLYYYTVHEYREDEEGVHHPGIHVHVIVSRKDISGRFKLSPMTNHRGESSGVIKSGFNRDAFYRDCEHIFDAAFGYQRRIADSYDYLNTLAHGSETDKAAMIRAAVKEEKIYEKITAALAKQAARLAREAASEDAKKRLEEEQARLDEDKKKRNAFWNSYHSYYRPTLDELDKQCKAAFSLYHGLKEEKTDISEEISQEYQKLKQTYDIISQKKEEMERAENFESLVKALALMMASVNPMLSLVAGLVLMILLEIKKVDAHADVVALRKKADEIRDGLETLKGQRDNLRFAQQDALKQYIQVKDDKTELTEKLQELRKELEPKKESIDLDSLEKELAQRKGTPKEPSLSQVFSAFSVYGTLMSAESKLDLDLDLLTSNSGIEPVFHPNGGIADFEIIINHEKSLASHTYSDEKLTAMLEKWSELTGQLPAFRNASDTEPEKNLVTMQQPRMTKSVNKPKPSKYKLNL